MKSLLWKQWHENKGYFAILMAWMILAVCYCIGYELGHRYRAVVGTFSGVAGFYTICAAVFIAMRTSQGEQAAGTLSFSTSLPVSVRRIATVRCRHAGRGVPTRPAPCASRDQSSSSLGRSLGR